MALLFPLLALHAAWLAFRRGDRRYLRERLGLFKEGAAARIWIHAASVGEVNAAVPLVNALRRRHPEWKLLVTTVTVTGAAAVRAKMADVEHRYLPLDRLGGVRRLLAATRPGCALIVETELWPNLYAACAEREIPLAIVNGRISERTLSAPGWLRALYGEVLSIPAAILARTEEDAGRFLRLGAKADRIRVAGNIKFAAAPSTTGVEPITLARPYVLAASTREGEEKRVVEAWERTAIASHLLVIAPRHPDRLRAILKDLGGRAIAVRSRRDAVTPETAIYIADTFGELSAFMAGADLVFMGGSLVPKGGQNLLEAAALGRPILVGPHMENFAAETAELKAEAGLVQVRDGDELTQRFAALLADPEQRRRLGANARRVVDGRRGVAERYAEAVERLCACEPDQGRPM